MSFIDLICLFLFSTLSFSALIRICESRIYYSYEASLLLLLVMRLLPLHYYSAHDHIFLLFRSFFTVSCFLRFPYEKQDEAYEKLTRWKGILQRRRSNGIHCFVMLKINMDGEYIKQIDRVFACSIDFIFSSPSITKNHWLLKTNQWIDDSVYQKYSY